MNFDFNKYHVSTVFILILIINNPIADSKRNSEDFFPYKFIYETKFKQRLLLNWCFSST